MLSSLGECEQVMLLVQGDIKLSSRFSCILSITSFKRKLSTVLCEH